ncbi:MAG: hypothetical protein ACR2N7_03615 [Acidimicrobiia bacterium]
MNDQDRDLILALAAGRLSTEEAAAASARIEANPELAEELSAQRTAIEALATVPEPAMTAEESTALRSSLATQLNIEELPAPVPVKRRLPWWQPAFGIAAAAVFVTAVIILPGTLSEDDTSATDSEQQFVALDQAPTTLAVSSQSDDSASSPPQTESPADGQAAPESSLPEPDGVDLLNATRGQDDPAEMDESLEEVGVTKRSSVDADRVASCLDTLAAELPPGEKHVLGAKPSDDGEVVFIGVDDGEGVSAVVSISLDTCSIVDIDR